MAILAMEHIRLIAMIRDHKAILDMLQRQGMIDISDETHEDEVFQKVDTLNIRQALYKDIETAEESVTFLDKYAGCKGQSMAFLHGRKTKSIKEGEAILKKQKEDMNLARRIVFLEQEMREAEVRILRLNMELASLEPWLGLSVPQQFDGTKKTAIFIGILEGEYSLESIHQKIEATNPELSAIHIEIISDKNNQTCIMVIAPKYLRRQTEEGLRNINFARPPSAGNKIPVEEKVLLNAEVDKISETIMACKSELESYAQKREDLCYLQDSLKIRADKYEIEERLMQSAHVFVLSGYLPADAADAVERKLTDNYDCAVERTIAERPGGEVPVLLKNNWFAEPTEGIVESYSMPGQEDIDPTAVMSVFYYLMFGLMFGDAGYGFIMAGICGFLLVRFKNMEPNWSKNIRMFFWCGIATIFWGVIFSSYFGNAVDVIGKTFFGVDVSIPPVWFYIEEKPMLMLVFCLGLGILHLTAGFIMKGITVFRNGDKAGIICETVFPLMLWYPLMVLLANSDMFFGLAGIRLPLTESAISICQNVAVVAVVGIILTGGRGTKNIALRLLQGLFAAYNALSGWLGDMLSYSRLLALGLASGVIASVMNQLGSMVGKGVVGVIAFIIIFIFGHAMNFGINVLGAYVHSNRLEYIEFFGKFYEGGGRKFKPLKMQTKYYKIIEEE